MIELKLYKTNENKYYAVYPGIYKNYKAYSPLFEKKKNLIKFLKMKGYEVDENIKVEDE